MFSTNSPATFVTSRGALDRALALVAEESFFAMVDPVPENLPAVEGQIVSASVTFEGSFSGAVTCRMPRALAHELTAAFTGEDVPSDGEVVDDLAGEFANMVCGRWLTDVAPHSLFRLDQPVVVPASAPPRAPTGLLNGQPIWVDLKIEG
jgi:Chemotaxis phosphatase CheX